MISVIIVNYNRKDLLKQCLDSLLRQDFKDMEIIVIDNASRDGSVEMIKAGYPGVRLMQNSYNALFCKAQNQGIEASMGDFVLCLNSDVILEQDYLKEVFCAVKKDERIGMVSGKIFRMDKIILDSTGLFLGRNRKAMERGYGKKDTGRYDRPEYVFGVSGACAFLRKSMLVDIKDKNGYFDERFGMYYEDLDLCFRARKKNWKAYYNPKAVAYHARGGTAIRSRRGKGPVFIYLEPELKKLYIVNRYRYMVKNDSLRDILLNFPFILTYEIKIYFYIIINFLLTRVGRHSII